MDDEATSCRSNLRQQLSQLAVVDIPPHKLLPRLAPQASAPAHAYFPKRAQVAPESQAVEQAGSPDGRAGFLAVVTHFGERSERCGSVAAPTAAHRQLP